MITHVHNTLFMSLCWKKKIYKFKGSRPAALRSCEAVEVQRIEGKKTGSQSRL